MQVEAIQGYFDRGIFYQQGRRAALPERRLVIVNVLDIPVDAKEIQNEDAEFWTEFDKLARESADEKLMISDFPRVHLARELVLFDDEEKTL